MYCYTPINRHAGSDFLGNNLWNIINKQFQFSFGLANMRGVKFSNAWREKFKRMSWNVQTRGVKFSNAWREMFKRVVQIYRVSERQDIWRQASTVLSGGNDHLRNGKLRSRHTIHVWPRITCNLDLGVVNEKKNPRSTGETNYTTTNIPSFENHHKAIPRWSPIQL